MIPLFDSLAHPTLTGKWINNKNKNEGANEDASFESLIQSLDETNFIGACAVGLAGVEDYHHKRFMERCASFKKLVPIAGFKPTKDYENELKEIKALGFKGIKIHRRLSNLYFSDLTLIEALKFAAKLELIIFICSYHHTTLLEYPTSDPFYDFVKLLKNIPTAKTVIVHGGDINLLRYTELARFNHNLLLDLSLTIMKYKHSSIDNDIRFLFESFYTRICVGTDHPEHSHASLRARFEYFSEGLLKEKIENIAYQNIATFLSL